MRKLILSITKKDLRIDTFRAGGKGGQNQNKRDSGVRIVHQKSGAVGESREHRTQLENKKAAFRRMANHPRLRIWIAKQIHVDKIQESSTRRYTYRDKADMKTRKMDRE